MTIGPLANVSRILNSICWDVSSQESSLSRTPAGPTTGGVVSDIRYTESLARYGVIFAMSRVDHEAQKAVTRSTFAFSAVDSSAPAAGIAEASAAMLARPAAFTNERRSNLLSERVGIQCVPRRNR